MYSQPRALYSAPPCIEVKTGTGQRKTQAQIPAVLFPSCVTLLTSLGLSVKRDD